MGVAKVANKKREPPLIIGERAKRARHSQVCSIENRGYIYYWRASETSETLSGLFNRESYIY